MWMSVVNFLALLGIQILKAMGVKAEIKKNFLEWAKRYNTHLFKQSSMLADEFKAIKDELRALKSKSKAP